jgi:hypothetical protein
MVDSEKLVRRAPSRPLVWLGERERDVNLSLGERFPATASKEKDFVLPLRRDPR